MKFKNTSQSSVFVEGFGVVKAGAELDVKDGYALPRRARNGQRIPSVIESVAPQLRPVDKADLARFLGTPSKCEEVPPPRNPTAASLEAQGVAPGVAAIMADKASVREEAAFAEALAAEEKSEKAIHAAAISESAKAETEKATDKQRSTRSR